MTVHLISPDNQAKLEEIAAYHEAGHAVVAADQGLSLKARGLHIDALGKGICYYSTQPDGSDALLERLITAAKGGYISNLYFGHPCPDWATYGDYWCVGRLLQQMSSAESIQRIRQRLWKCSEQIVERHHGAIEALAKALLAKEPTPRPAEEDWSESEEPCEKWIAGGEAASLLNEHGIPAVCDGHA